ncbi:MAG: hydroxyethylthiazole kinase, partial [Finegoldia magna]|nr:hydroxyethylthiazole kinase [Finegoldia magna]
MDNLIQKMSEIYSDLYNSNNLIHCLTNAISINDMANAVLSVNQSPFMADNPREVEDVTRKSDSLLVNLGNITDYRIESIKKSVRIANENNIPITFDLVGVSASRLRLDLTLEILQKHTITCIKGNYSEIKSMFIKDLSTKGVDSQKLEVDDVINYCKDLHEKYHSIVVATGHMDIVCSDEIYLLN